MHTRTLGQGLRVSAVCLGAMGITVHVQSRAALFGVGDS
jgi:aryl-alcohol dehydrogenase-like predicted oxidoreductase